MRASLLEQVLILRVKEACITVAYRTVTSVAKGVQLPAEQSGGGKSRPQQGGEAEDVGEQCARDDRCYRRLPDECAT